MDYEKHYKLLCSSRQALDRKKLKISHSDYCYYEWHHIVQRHEGGGDELGNLVLLTAREHFIAHWLFAKWKQTIASYAAVSSFRGNNHKLNSIQYEIARKAASRAQSMRIGELNSFYNRKHSEQTKLNWSLKRRKKPAYAYADAVSRLDFGEAEMFKRKISHCLPVIIEIDDTRHIINTCEQLLQFNLKTLHIKTLLSAGKYKNIKAISQASSWAFAELKEKLVSSINCLTEPMIMPYSSFAFIGTGKCFDIAKLSANTMSSLGRPSFAISCTDLLHGGLGALASIDCIFALSKSAKTEETNSAIDSIYKLWPSKKIYMLTLAKDYAGPAEPILLAQKCIELNGFSPTSSSVQFVAWLMAFAEINRAIDIDEFVAYHPSGTAGK